MAQLSLQHIQKIYDNQVHVVKDFNLEIADKEFIVFVGPSGCGKSTTLRMIAGLEEISGGDLLIDGKRMNDVPAKARNIAMVFQNYALYPHMTVYDNMAFGLKMQKIAKEVIDERVNWAAQILGLREYLKRKPGALSGGQRQRIGIARALVMNPDLVIADEAISALDVSIQAQVVNLMKDIQKETGCAYLFIAHDLSMVKYISDRIGVLHLGHLVETGSKDEIFENPVHPYTKSLLSAIPHTNPRVEKQRKAVGYDYAKSGIHYENGTRRLVGGTHYVLATEEEFAAWTARKGAREA